MWGTVLKCGIGIFLIVWGCLALIAGIKKKNKSFFLQRTWETDKSIPLNNVIGGCISIVGGILIFILYAFGLRSI